MEHTSNQVLVRARPLLPIAAALLSQLYLYPFDGSFKLTAGVLLLGCAAFLLPRRSLLRAVLAAGLLTVLLRAAWDLTAGVGWPETASRHLPSLVFYLVYGAALCGIDPGRFLEQFRPVAAALALAACDFAGNLSENLLRGSAGGAMIRTIAVVALLRGCVSMAMGVAWRYHRVYLAEEGQRRRYVEQTMRVAQLRAEMVYLQKSGEDIERVMKQGYALYHRFREQPDVSGPALEIARGIHEVGKDYRRIVSELQVLLGGITRRTMRISEVLQMVQESFGRFCAAQEHPPRLLVRCSGDGEISRCYSMLSVVSNLVVNAAQAAGEGGEIHIDAAFDRDRLRLSVSDNGPGIEKELLEDIFLPGFTTKFDPATGEASAGIGLCHVKNLVEASGGTITVRSAPGEGAVFTVEIPETRREGDAHGNTDAD